MAESTGPVVPENRAKQGLRGLHVLWVLAISTVLAALVLVAVWAMRAPSLGSVHGTAAAPASAAKTYP